MRANLCLFAAATALKLLLVPAYKSTDFEVHRNWLAVTASKPVRQWYHEATSQWTLDYPPLFAVFEWILSLAVPFVDANALNISASPYESWKFTVFHRCSVIVTDVVLLAGCIALSRVVARSPGLFDSVETHQRVLTAIIFLNPCLLVVDHVHFQYNGMLLGLLFLVLAWTMQVCRLFDDIQ